jgi:hypothetical protein
MFDTVFSALPFTWGLWGVPWTCFTPRAVNNFLNFSPNQTAVGHSGISMGAESASELSRNEPGH